MIGRRLLFTGIVILSFLPLTSYSWAWQFKIDSGLFEFRYSYFTQKGTSGFFGPYDTDMGSTGGDLAPLNGWYYRGMVSGTTDMVSSIRLWLFPALELNEAVAIYGTYLVGPYNTEPNLREADFDIETTETLITDGKWTRLWVRINTPLGRITYGKRYFRQGCGLQFGAGRRAEEIFESDRRSEEILLLESGYGPFTVGLGFYPWRRGSAAYWNQEDHRAARAFHVLAFIGYTAKTVDAGVGGFAYRFHEGPEAYLSTAVRASVPPATTTNTEGWIYLKYGNGVLFFNAEADWCYRVVRHQSSQDGTFFGEEAVTPGGGGSLFAPRYIESWRFMTEFGTFYGPANGSITHASTSRS